MNRPAETNWARSPFSLNWVIRLSSPYDAVHSISQLSCACSATWLWTKRMQTSGSRPAAARAITTSRVLVRSSAGSWGTVRAWRSTTQYMASYSC